MQLLKNKREAVTTAVSDEWWLMVEAIMFVIQGGINWVYELDTIYILLSMFAYILTKE